MAEQAYEPRLKTEYRERIRAAMKEQFGYTNEMQIPKLDKIVLNMGIGEAVGELQEGPVGHDGPGRDRRPEAGGRPRPAQSIAGFKLREGMIIGAKVTLRKDRMYEFLDRLITIALPRVKDFRGLKPHELRRPRQLRHGPEGAHRVPGDQLRPDRPDVGHGHHRRHDREDRRGGPGASARNSSSRSYKRRAGRKETHGQEKRRQPQRAGSRSSSSNTPPSAPR